MPPFGKVSKSLEICGKIAQRTLPNVCDRQCKRHLNMHACKHHANLLKKYQLHLFPQAGSGTDRDERKVRLNNGCHWPTS